MHFDFETPRRLSQGAWHGHMLFAQWIIRVINPEIFVELGTHNGDSYFSFCQSVKKNGLKTKCHAVDSWQGEPHAGFYGEDVFKDVNLYNKENYAEFSTLHRCLFDEAVSQFKDKSIELLHIDGFHTYEAVKHDFETWVPKLAKNAVVLFHDTAETRKDFGVWRFWEELEEKYQETTYNFLHSHGLGVLGLGTDFPEELATFFQSKKKDYSQLRQFYSKVSGYLLESKERERNAKDPGNFNIYIDTGKGLSESEKESSAVTESSSRVKFFLTNHKSIQKIRVDFSITPKLILIQDLVATRIDGSSECPDIISGSYSDRFDFDPEISPNTSLFLFTQKNPRFYVKLDQEKEYADVSYYFKILGLEEVTSLVRVQELDVEVKRLKDSVEELSSRNNFLVVEKDKLFKEIELKKNQAEEAAVKLNDLLSEKESLLENLVVKDKEIESRDRGLEEKAREIESRHRELESKVKEIEIRDRELENKDKEIESRAIELEEKDREIESRDRELESKVKEIESRDRELESKDKVIESRDRELESKDKEIKSRDRELESKDKEIKSRDRELEEKNKEIKQLATRVSTQDKVIERFKENSISKEKEMNQLQENLKNEIKENNEYFRILLREKRVEVLKRYQRLKFFIIIKRSIGFIIHPRASLEYRKSKKDLLQSGLFDEDYYLEKNKDLYFTPNLVRHYLLHGYKEGREVHPLFDSKYYCEAYEDVKFHGVNPLLHYVRSGWKEGRMPSMFKDNEDYKNGYDERKAFKTELLKKSINFKNLIKKIFQLNLKRMNEDKLREIEITKSNKKTCKFRKNRIAVFASFSNKYVIEDYVVYYLSELKKVCDVIIMISDNPTYLSELIKIKPYVELCVFKHHGEYDFGSYKIGFEIAERNGYLNKANEIIFCNDSCFGPVNGFDSMFNKMKTTKSDFWGITINHQFKRHIQSYFVVFKKNVFTSHSFKEFLLKVKKEDTVKDVILKYEIEWGSYLENCGFRFSSYIPEELNDLNIDDMNYTFFPLTLARKYHHPLIKVKAIEKPITNREAMNELILWLNLANAELLKRIVKKANNNVSFFMKIRNCNEEVGFSVVMPTHNRKNVINYSIKSVLNQCYIKYELIIVDDGSTDGTEDEVKNNYKNEIKSGKIIYVKTDKVGVSKARNIGIEKSRFKWIAYLDSDNALLNDSLKVFNYFIKNNPGRGVLYAQGISINSKKIIGDEFDRKKLYFGNYIDLGGVVHRKNLFNEYFDINLKRLVDYDLLIRLSQKEDFLYIPHPTFLYDDAINKDIKKRISEIESYNKNYKYLIRKHPFIENRVTTIIPSYNHEKYIVDAVKSVEEQKGNISHKILISDDSSIDQTSERILQNFNNNPNIQVNILNDNIGLSNNLKSCIDKIDTEFFAICEGDDYWIDDYKLHKQIKFLRLNPDCSMVFSKIKLYSEDRKIYKYLGRQENLKKKLDGYDFLNHKSMNLIGNFSSCVFRTKEFKKIPEFVYEGRINEITVAFHMERYGKIGFLPEVLSVYRQHRSGLWSGANKEEQLESGLQVRLMTLKVADKKYQTKIMEIIEKNYKNELI